MEQKIGRRYVKKKERERERLTSGSKTQHKEEERREKGVHVHQVSKQEPRAPQNSSLFTQNSPLNFLTSQPQTLCHQERNMISNTHIQV